MQVSLAPPFRPSRLSLLWGWMERIIAPATLELSHRSQGRGYPSHKLQSSFLFLLPPQLALLYLTYLTHIASHLVVPTYYFLTSLHYTTMRPSYASEPILCLQPREPPLNMATEKPTFSSPFPSNGFNASPQSSSWSTRTPTASTPISAAGRKRSRDEAAFDDDYFPVLLPVAPAPAEDEEEWEYGPGMTLIKPNRRGYIAEAGSQTGTWAEEKAVEQETAMATASSPERPPLRSAKSQRLDFSSTPAIAEEVMSNGALVTPITASPTNEPTIDDFTRHLGIGWSLLSADEDIQAAARGWTKFINNHFPVTDAKIRLQSRGLASYLVEANEGYFLFGEDLKQGRLLSTSLEKTWENLRGPVPVFDGEVVMEVGETPKLNGGIQPLTNAVEMVMAGTEEGVSNGTSALNGMNGGNVDAGPSMEVEMDMS